MDKLPFPITLLFLTSTRGHFDRKYIWLDTLNHLKRYNILNDFQFLKAHIKVSPGEESLGEQMADTLHSFGFSSYTTIKPWAHFSSSHFVGIIEDLNKLANTVKTEYVYIFEDDWNISNYEQFYLTLNEAKNLLNLDKDAICVRWPRHLDDENHYPGTEPYRQTQYNNQGHLYSFNPNLIIDLPGGLISTDKSDTCELLYPSGELVQAICPISHDKLIPQYCHDLPIYTLHLGYLSLERRKILNKTWWRPKWEERSNKKENVIISLKKLKEEETIEHHLDLW